MSIGLLSLFPPALAVFLAFKTRNTIFSLFVAITLGVLVAGPVISNGGFKSDGPFAALSKIEEQGMITSSEKEEIRQALQSKSYPISASLLEKLEKNTSNSDAATVLKGYNKTQGFSLYERLLNIPSVFKISMGTTSFSWILLLELFIGILIAFFQRTGAIAGFTQVMQKKNLSRKGVQLSAWGMGMFVYFSDYFSPLFVGSVMRSLSDSKKISREKLAYIADSTSAPVSVLVPITGWAAFLTGLIVGFGDIQTIEQASPIFLRSIPFNFYALFSVALVGLLALKIVPEYGPMKKAEKRAIEEGKVLADDADPLLSKELTAIAPYNDGKFKPRIMLNFIVPVLIVIVIAIGTYVAVKSAKTMEAFLTAALFLAIVMRIQGIPFKDIMHTLMEGIKGVTPAIIILAMAYTINDLSKLLGTANYVISLTEGMLSPMLLPLFTFLIAAFIAFSTGTSWGTFAIMMPLAIPLALNSSGGEFTTLAFACIAAVAGGGVFGDHASPLSDTTILASTGAASDHIDHVKTQIPYALTCAAVACIAYLILGLASG